MADTKTNPKRLGFTKKLNDFFIKAQGGPESFNIKDKKNNPIYAKWDGVDMTAENKKAMNKALKSRADLLASAQNPEGATLGDTARLGLGAASAHPFLTGAGALTTGMNVAGLMDNDKFGGQLGGAALGGLASYFGGLTPGYAYLATTAGGALGSLFDKLRAKREQEAQQAQAMQQYYR